MPENEIAEIKAAIKDLDKSVSKLDSKQDQHKEVISVVMQNQLLTMQEIREDLKQQRSQNTETREHFDRRLAEYSKDFRQVLKNDYTPSVEIKTMNQNNSMRISEKNREDITSAIQASEFRQDKKIQQLESKAKLMAWVVSSLLGVAVAVSSIFKGNGP